MKSSLYQGATLLRNKSGRKGAFEPIAWISASVQAIFKSIFINPTKKKHLHRPLKTQVLNDYSEQGARGSGGGQRPRDEHTGPPYKDRGS